MSRPRPTAGARQPLDLERLRALADLLGAVDLQPGHPPRIVRVLGVDDDELELGFLELDEGDHPLAFLAGFVAPPEWQALGVICTGRARHVDDLDGERVPVRAAQVVARGGAWASTVVPLDAGGGGSGQGTAEDAPTGRVDDALRRALGLPTPPPPASTELLWATQWLDALLAEAAAGGPPGRARRRPLAALVSAHPAVAAFDDDPARVTVAGLVAAGSRLAALRGWAALRQACAGGRWHDPEVPADVAAWLDDGAFARWVLGGYPDLAQLRDALAALLAPSALSVIDDALTGWGLRTDPGGS